MATLVKGRVKFPAGRVFNTQYGERINIVVELPDKQEIKLWGKPGDIIGTIDPNILLHNKEKRTTTTGFYVLSYMCLRFFEV